MRLAIQRSSSSSSTTMMALSSFLLLLVAPLAASSTASSKPLSKTMLRHLEENGYQYLDDLSSYQMQFGKCVRVKVPQDDDGEGNSYFYNGHYYSQGMQFASVFLCADPYSNYDSYFDSTDVGTCGICDATQEYVVDLATYLETNLEYVETLCQSCNYQCYGDNQNNQDEQEEEEEEQEDEDGENRRQLRRLEDEVVYMNVDCNTCMTQCQTVENNQQNHDGADETAFLECQEAFQDEDGNVVYSGPQCDSAGDIVIGYYYDDECSVKSSSVENEEQSFDYSTFRVMQEMCVSCGDGDQDEDNDNGDDNDGNQVCDTLYQAATHCSQGRTLNGGDDGDMPICKAYKSAHRERTYAAKNHHWRIAEIIAGSVLVLGFTWGFLTLSYTYFLRHRQSKHAANKTPLADADHTQQVSAPTIETTDKPPVVPTIS